jgi:hypothetical protein
MKPSPSLAFATPILALAACLREWRIAGGSARQTEAARGSTRGRTLDYSRSSAFEALQRACEASAPPGA